MKSLIISVAVLIVLACCGENAEARCRIGNGRIINRIRQNHLRLFHRWHENQKKNDKKDDKKCPDCKPKKTMEEEFEELDQVPELLPPPRLIME